MKIIKTTEMLHPVLKSCVDRIQKEIIDAHRMPIRLFETGRTHERHNTLFKRGKTKDLMSQHLFDLEHNPPLYTTAVDYVYYDTKWSWNIRDSSIECWYKLFGNSVLDICPEMQWGAHKRKSVNYCHFELRTEIIIDRLDAFPCVVPK